MSRSPAPWQRPIPDAWREGSDELPATHVDWFDCLAFCNALSLLAGRSPCYEQHGHTWTCDWSAAGYRLPSEAEWEYACRGGTETPWFWGDREAGADDHAWFSENAGHELHPVGTKKPNDFDLHDMAGNVWEWCWDWYHDYEDRQLADPKGPENGRLRVLRGGSFAGEPRDLRSAARVWFVPANRSAFIGFRCVRSGARSLEPRDLDPL